MIKVGSTMTTEAWDEEFKPNLTWNHAWGSAPANIIPRRLMGIEPLEAGYKRFSIVPQPSNLKDIALTVPTINGSISSHLKVNENEKELSWIMNITVPGNTESELWLPNTFAKISVNGVDYPIDTEKFISNADRRLIILPAGSYEVIAK
jgi:hypothetical protein